MKNHRKFVFTTRSIGDKPTAETTATMQEGTQRVHTIRPSTTNQNVASSPPLHKYQEMAMESVLADDPLSKLAEETSPPFVFTPPTRHTPLKKVASENRGQFPGPSDSERSSIIQYLCHRKVHTFIDVYSFLMVDVVKSSIHINAVKKSATLLSILSPKRSHRRSASLEVLSCHSFSV